MGFIGTKQNKVDKNRENHVLIIGANDIGILLAKSLGNEGQNTFLIDEGEHIQKKLDEEIDVFALAGNPVSLNLLHNLGVNKHTCLIAVTYSDRLNLLLLLLGYYLGVREAHALINDQEYYNSFYPFISRLGKNLHLINLWEVVSQKIERKYGLEIKKININDERNNTIMAVKFFGRHPLIGKRMVNFGGKNRIFKVIRRGTYLNEFDRYLIESGDILVIKMDLMEQKRLMGKLISFASINKLVIGGDAFIQCITERWPDFSRKLVCIEKNIIKCKKIIKLTGDALVLNGDGLDISLLNEAGIEGTQIFIAATENDELNLLSSLLARSYGVKEVLTILKKRQHTGMLERLKLDGIISIPQLLVDYFLIRIVYKKNKGFMDIDLIYEKGDNLTEGVHLVYRGGMLLPLEQTVLRNGEEVITLKFKL